MGYFLTLHFHSRCQKIMLPVIGNQHPVRQRQYNTHRRRFSCPQQPIMVSSLLPMHYRLLKTVCIMPYAIWHEIPPSPTRWIQNCMHYAVLCSNRWCIMTFVTVLKLVGGSSFKEGPRRALDERRRVEGRTDPSAASPSHHLLRNKRMRTTPCSCG